MSGRAGGPGDERQTWTFDVGHESTRATWFSATRSHDSPHPARPALVLAPGAGAGQAHPFMTGLAARVAAAGVDVVTFDFPYIANGRKRPDAPATLESAWRHAVAFVRARAADPRRLMFIGGKSMGGRIATQAASAGGAEAMGLSGVVCVGYPLRPPGRADARRMDHFDTIPVPVLVVQGTRDAFGGPGDVSAALGRRAGVTIEAVEEADHGFAVPRRTGRTNADVLDDVAARIAAWIFRVKEHR